MKKILIIDDEIFNRKLFSKVLDKYGVTEIAQNGFEGLDKFTKSIEQDDVYDLVILDIMMPEMSGFEVLEKMREIEKEKGLKKTTKIIVSSVLADIISIEKAYSFGIERYLVKPLDIAEVREVCDEIL